MSRPLRLTAYTDATSVGGAEISLGNLLEALNAHVDATLLGTDVDVLQTIAARRRDTSVRVVPRVRNKYELRPLFAHVAAVRALRPDVLHVNLQTPWSGQYGILAGLLVPGVRVVAVEQCPLPMRDARQRRLKRIASRRLAAHVAVGDRASRDIETFVGLSSNSVRTIRNGVPDVSLTRLETQTRDGPAVMGTVGRLDRLKGFDLLVRALARLPDVTAVVIGDGSERAALEALSRELGVDDRIEFLGWRQDPRAYLATLDIFVLPSRSEGFPLAIVEAMLAGLPVVATDVGSVAEAVAHEETGLLVPADDVEALTAAIRRLADEPALRARLGSEAHKRALDRFTASVMAREFEQLYEELLA